MKYNKPINENLSVRRCWDMVNATQNGKTPEDIRERCKVAIKWLDANKVINIDQYDDMMRTLSYIVRESYHM